ncbi:MarR family transcriptional regulator [Erythrobacter sp. SCSIO 43205]|uniref:MarR family transcriptional regulator n=1 Tax=Erythrobacter sp. SCSIO 43205 TaxID=2779361 RepID=UPI001CA86811|nr:MarR family transcriptional regulator [Erythrobacter sp. SCSIO 43205]UAB79390.1 MarR family transcriptional regulator [Erythrobacter sp. SCSIO 43205]
MFNTDTSTADFSYDCAQDASGLPARVAIYSDRAWVREEIGDDLSGAGFRCVEGGALTALIDGPISLLGDVVMVDCPQVDAGNLAALARLDMRVGAAGAHLIVTTSLDALESVFAALDQSKPQILVEPSRAERLVAVGRTLSQIGNARVREMTEEDRLSLLYLSRQVDAIAHELDKLSGPRGHSRESSQETLSDFKREFRGPEENRLFNSVAKDRLVLGSDLKTQLPDPQMVRAMIARRQARAKFFDGDLFADPAWDMLLDLTAAEGEQKNVSVTSLCIAAMVPATTALRWIKQLVDSGVFERKSDPGDKRRAFIALSDRSRLAMARYFKEVHGPEVEAAEAA